MHKVVLKSAIVVFSVLFMASASVAFDEPPMDREEQAAADRLKERGTMVEPVCRKYDNPDGTTTMVCVETNAKVLRQAIGSGD